MVREPREALDAHRLELARTIVRSSTAPVGWNPLAAPNQGTIAPASV